MSFGFNTYIPGYQFSPMIWAGCSSSPFNTLNLMWNEGMMKLQCNSLLYQSPAFSFTQGGFFPLFGGNFSSIPNMLAQQTFSQFNMNNWWNNPTVGGVNNGFGFNFANIFGNGNNGANNSVDSATTVEGTKLATLKNIYEKLRNESNSARLGRRFITEEMEKEYAEALKKETTNGKIDAIEAILKKIPAARIQKIIMNDEKIKSDLHFAGYNNTLSNEKIYNWDDALDELYRVIEKEDVPVKLDKLGKFQGLINPRCASEITDNNDILQVISLWNDEYNKSTEKGLVRYIANHIPSQETQKGPYKDAIMAISTALTNKANDYKEYSNVSEKKVAVQNIAEKLEKKFDKTLALELADRCDELYAELRLMEAQTADKAIQEQYGFLNTEVKEGLVEENKILNETKADLEKEGITVPEVTLLNDDEDDEVEEGQVTYNFDSLDKLPAEQRIKALAEKYLTETDVEGVYSTKTNSSNADEKFYGVKDNKLVEFVGVKKAEEITDSTPTKEVKKCENIDKYTKTVKRIDNLVSKGLIKEITLTDKANGVRVYQSVKQEYDFKKVKTYTQKFVIMNDELMMLKDEKAAISKNGWIDFQDGTKKHVSKLTAADVKTFTDNEIWKEKKAEDKKAEEKNEEADKTSNSGKASQEEIDAQVSLVTENTYYKKSDITPQERDRLGIKSLAVKGYYKDRNGQYYRYSQKDSKLVHLPNVKKISASGEMTLNDGKKVPCREYQSAFDSGKELMKSVYMCFTNEDDYNTMRRKLNSFKTYESTEEIYQFLKGVEEGTGLFEDKFCRQIATEYGLEKEEKQRILVEIATKVKKFALDAGLDDEDKFDKYKLEVIEKIINNEWDKFNTLMASNTSTAAGKLDSVIIYVIEKYEKKNNPEAEKSNSEEDFVDNWEDKE